MTNPQEAQPHENENEMDRYLLRERRSNDCHNRKRHHPVGWHTPQCDSLTRWIPKFYMPQINCPSCKHQFFADSPGAFVTSAGFAIAGAIIFRLCFGHLIIWGLDMDLPSPPIDPRFLPPQSKSSTNDLSHGVTVIAGVIGWWGVIGLFIGYCIGLAADHFSRRCPKCGHKQ